MKNKIVKFICVPLFFLSACQSLNTSKLKENRNLPKAYATISDTVNSGLQPWREFYKDSNLIALIDTALSRNQELKLFQQELAMLKNDVLAKTGAYQPFVGLGAGISADKFSAYSSQGVFDANNNIITGKKNPEPMTNYVGLLNATWEIDIWKKLRNAKASAMHRYLAGVEGRNFLVTNLVSEIAETYYDLLALDNQYNILNATIDLYQNSLEIVKLEKISARVTELAVRRFEAEVLKNQSKLYYLKQQITETQNRLNFLLGRYPQEIKRASANFLSLKPDSLHTGIPAQLLVNRPDIRRAEQNLAAANLDIRAARAQFYPALMLGSSAGLGAFSPAYFLHAPQSLVFNLLGGVMAPLINRKDLRANLYSANAKQTQAVVAYEKTMLSAYIEVLNQMANMRNLQRSYELKDKQVERLTTSIDISGTLFKSARADYMEVLLTQRDALDAKFELVETKKQQINATINMYRALGGGWR